MSHKLTTVDGVITFVINKGDCGVDFKGKIKEKKDRVKPKLSKGFGSEVFEAIWDKIKYQTKYSVNYETEELIKTTAKAMNNELQMPPTKASAIHSATYKVNINEQGVDGNILREKQAIYKKEIIIPDALSYIQNKTELTRDTILQILKQSKRINELLINPQMFLDNVVRVIKSNLNQLMIEGITYQKIEDKIYAITLFHEKVCV